VVLLKVRIERDRIDCTHTGRIRHLFNALDLRRQISKEICVRSVLIGREGKDPAVLLGNENPGISWRIRDVQWILERQIRKGALRAILRRRLGCAMDARRAPGNAMIDPKWLVGTGCKMAREQQGDAGDGKRSSAKSHEATISTASQE
jgi:hypothetical protein